MMTALSNFANHAVLWLQLARTKSKNRAAYLACGAASALLAACGFLPQTMHVPIPLLRDNAHTNKPAKKLIVMLPGIYDRASDFLKAGFVQDLRTRNIDADIIIAEAHFSYYEARAIEARLEADVFAAARSKGYREIWLLGVSLGGLGAMLYSAQSAETISGIVLIAPYPGSASIHAEIQGAGGPIAWAQSPLAQGPDERRALRWLASISAAQTDRSARVTQVFLGSGTADRFITGQRVLSQLLPSQRVNFVEGGHEWAAWRKIWQDFLDNGPWALEAAKQAELDGLKL